MKSRMKQKYVQWMHEIDAILRKSVGVSAQEAIEKTRADGLFDLWFSKNVTPEESVYNFLTTVGKKLAEPILEKQSSIYRAYELVIRTIFCVGVLLLVFGFVVLIFWGWKSAIVFGASVVVLSVMFFVAIYYQMKDAPLYHWLTTTRD